MDSDTDVTTELNQSVSTSPIEIQLLFSLPNQASSENRTSPQLDLNQWKRVFANCNLLHGIRMDKETLKYANRPALKFKEAVSSIPIFTVNDKFYINAYLGNKLMESPFLSTKFFDSELNTSSPFMSIGIHSEWLKYESRSNEERIMYSTCSFNEPRVTVALNLSYLEVTSQFIDDIDIVLRLPSEKQILALKEVLSTYGHVYPQKIILGGYLYYIESHLIKEKDDHTALNSAQQNFVTSFKMFAKIDVESDNSKSSGTWASKDDCSKMFQAVGGDRSLMNDVTNWANSLDNSMLWRVVKYDDFQPIITLLSQKQQDAITKIIKGDTQSQATATTGATSSSDQGNLHNMLNISSWCFPQILSTNTKPTTFKVSVMPAWLAENKPELQVLYPTGLTMEDKETRYIFDMLAKYRSVQNNQNVVNFNTHPFIPNVASHETLIAMLSMFARSLGMQMSVADTSFSYEDSAYRCACGVADLASLFWINDINNSTILTAKFTFILDIEFSKITMSEETIKDFTLSFIKDVGTILDCPFEYVRVFDLTEGSLKVTFGITTPDRQHTINLATRLKDTARHPISSDGRRILHHTKPQDYQFEMESILTHLQLHPNNFESRHNRNYKNWRANDSVQTRGNRPYYLPVGWYRHALNVVDKYGASDQIWLGMCNGPNEWSVAYHGTKNWFVRDIIEQGIRSGQRDLYKVEAIQMVGARANLPAIYLATHCENGADEYATPFDLPNSSQGTLETYKIIFQCRLKPDTFTEHAEDLNVKYLRVYDRDGVRPYGILLKKVSPNSDTEEDAGVIRGSPSILHRLFASLLPKNSSTY